MYEQNSIAYYTLFFLNLENSVLKYMVLYLRVWFFTFRLQIQYLEKIEADV